MCVFEPKYLSLTQEIDWILTFLYNHTDWEVKVEALLPQVCPTKEKLHYFCQRDAHITLGG